MRRLILAFVLFSSATVGSVSQVASVAHAADSTTLTLVKSVADNSHAADYLGTPGWSKLADNSRSGSFEYADQQVRGDYNWTMPATIPAEGAPMTLTATATDHSGYRMYAYIGVSDPTHASISTKAGAVPKIEITAEADHNNHKDTATVTKTVTLLPDAASSRECGCMQLNLMLGPSGPNVTYSYKQVAESESSFRFHVTARPDAQASEGVPAHLFEIDAHGQGSKHTVGDLSSAEGTVRVEASWAKAEDELTTLKLVGKGTYYPPDSRKAPHVVSMILRVKDSTLDGCDAGALGRTRVTDFHNDDKADTVVIKYCGRQWFWEREPSNHFQVHVSAK